MIKKPLVMPESPEELEDGYEYKTINWLHQKGFEEDGWEIFGHTPKMQFLVMRKKIDNQREIEK